MLEAIPLINLAGAVALLLWGMHTASGDVLRDSDTASRSQLGRHLGDRRLAPLAGLGITGLLQNSTTTNLMAAPFAASSTLGPAPTLAVILGANAGTTLVVQPLSFNTSLLAPLVLLSGLLLFRLGGGPHLENFGQCLTGPGLILLALAPFGHSLQQIKALLVFAAVIRDPEGDLPIALLLAALLTWACCSGVAVVLLVASLAQAGLVLLSVALALVPGTNLGGALPTLGVTDSRVARHPLLGNLLMRLLGYLLVLPWLTMLAQPTNALGGVAVVWSHSAFNLALALLAIGFIGPLVALLARLLLEEVQSDEPGMPRYLSEAEPEVANIGLADATREVLRLADMASLVLRATNGLLQQPEAKVVAGIRCQDQALDQLSVAIHAYLVDLDQDGLGGSDADRAQETPLFIIDIEHIGDLVASSLLPLAIRRAGRNRTSSEFEPGYVLPLQAAIEESLYPAISVFLREDLNAALHLVTRKGLPQRLEVDANHERLRRLHDDHGAWVESGNAFRRIPRDYRRIHHHVTALTHPLLERNGIDPMTKWPDELGQGKGSACVS